MWWEQMFLITFQAHASVDINTQTVTNSALFNRLNITPDIVEGFCYRALFHSLTEIFSTKWKKNLPLRPEKLDRYMSLTSPCFLPTPTNIFHMFFVQDPLCTKLNGIVDFPLFYDYFFCNSQKVIFFLFLIIVIIFHVVYN